MPRKPRLHVPGGIYHVILPGNNRQSIFFSEAHLRISVHHLRHQLDFIARLAALVPKPGANLTRCHGVFTPNSKHRVQVTPAKRGKGSQPKRRMRRKIERAANVARP